MNEKQRTDDIVDTTDCLEAVSAFKSMKNLFFVISLICLLLLQGAFILDRTGFIDKESCKKTAICPLQCDSAVCDVKDDLPPQVPQDIQVNIEVSSEQPVKIQEPAALPQEAPTQLPAIITPSETVSEQSDTTEQVSQTETQETDTEKVTLAQVLKPKCKHVAWLIKICNFILIITATLYCLTLLMTIKISLTGRLGGINHISKAFFHSLFVLVFLLPWQLCFPAVIKGAIFTPRELLCTHNIIANSRVVTEIFCYLRFSGMWIIVVVLLFCAQLRSMKWSKATLRRLGIIQ